MADLEPAEYGESVNMVVSRRRVVLGWTPVFLLILCCLFTGCSDSGTPIEIVVPQNFTGPLWIVEDRERGESITLMNNRYRFVIPESRVLRVKSLQPFYQWHSETAKYADGASLRTQIGDSLPDDVVGLRGGGTLESSAGGQHVTSLPYFVGTKEAAKDFLEKPTGPPQ